MNIFPVSSSILSAPHIAGFVKDTYKLQGAVVARILKAGISHTYLVTADANNYIFAYTASTGAQKKKLQKK